MSKAIKSDPNSFGQLAAPLLAPLSRNSKALRMSYLPTYSTAADQLATNVGYWNYADENNNNNNTRNDEMTNFELPTFPPDDNLDMLNIFAEMDDDDTDSKSECSVDDSADQVIMAGIDPSVATLAQIFQCLQTTAMLKEDASMADFTFILKYNDGSKLLNANVPIKEQCWLKVTPIRRINIHLVIEHAAARIEIVRFSPPDANHDENDEADEENFPLPTSSSFVSSSSAPDKVNSNDAQINSEFRTKSNLNFADRWIEHATNSLHIPPSKATELWLFLLAMLADPAASYFHLIQWTRPTGMQFKLVDPEAVAKLWGTTKGNASMDYSKMARALRSYYRSGVLKKLDRSMLGDGNYYTYEFGFDVRQLIDKLAEERQSNQ